jgi:hypothetical protein
VGELRRVDNAKLDRKRHKPRRPNRRALMPVDLLRHSKISSHGFSPQLQIFLRSIVVKLRFRPRSPCNLIRALAGERERDVGVRSRALLSLAGGDEVWRHGATVPFVVRTLFR